MFSRQAVIAASTLAAAGGMLYWALRPREPVGFLPAAGTLEERVDYDAFDHRNDPPPVSDDAPTLTLPTFNLAQLQEAPLELDLQLPRPIAGAGTWFDGEIVHPSDEVDKAWISISFFGVDEPNQGHRRRGAARMSGWARTADGGLGRTYQYRISGYLPEAPGEYNVLIVVDHLNLDPDFKRLPMREWMQYTQVARGRVTIHDE